MARTNRILFEALCEETLETRCGRTQEEEYARCGRRVEGGAGSTRGNERALDMDMTLSTASGASWMHRAGVQCQRSLRITLGAPAALNVSSCVQFRAGCGWSVVGADLELDIVFSDAEMVVLDGYTDTVPVDSVCSRTWRVRLQSPSDRPTEPYTQSVTAEFVGTTSHELMLSDEPDQGPFEEQFSNDSPNVFDFVVNVFALQPGTGVDERMHLGRAAVLGTELIGHDTRHANGNRFAFSTRRPIVTSPGRVVGEFIFSYVVIEPYQGRYRAEALSAALQHCRAGRPRGVRIARTMNVTEKGSVAAASSDSTRVVTAPVANEYVTDETPFGSTLIGHRGGGERGTTPLQENTLLSFLAAVRGNNVRAIELDVQLTRDGVPVVHHDPVLQLPSDTDEIDLSRWRIGSRCVMHPRTATASPSRVLSFTPDQDVFGPSGFDSDRRESSKCSKVYRRVQKPTKLHPPPIGCEAMSRDYAVTSRDWARDQERVHPNEIDTDEESDEPTFGLDSSIDRLCMAAPGYVPRRTATSGSRQCCISRPIFSMDLTEWRQASARLLRRTHVDGSALDYTSDQESGTAVSLHRASRRERPSSSLSGDVDQGISFVSSVESMCLQPELGVSGALPGDDLDHQPVQGISHARSIPRGDSPAVEGSTAAASVRVHRPCHRCDSSRSTIRDTMPTLEEVLRQVPSFVHILVEIKYPIPETLREHAIPAPERNYLVDCILENVFRVAFADRRAKDADPCSSLRSRVSFLSFDPEICLLLRRKQNLCRVMFLCSEDRDGDLVPTDQRRMRAECALHFAHQAGLSGVVFFNEIVLAAGPPLIRLAHQVYKLLIMCYGRSNAVPECAIQLLEWQVDGIITDRVGYVARSLIQRQPAVFDHREVSRV